MTITELDVLQAPEDDLRALHDLVVTEHLELWDEDPVQPFDLWRREVTTPVSWRRTDRFVAWDDDHTRIDAVAALTLGFTETNRDHADIDVYVRPEARRRGLARAALRAALERAGAEGREMLNGGGRTDADAVPFAEGLGAE